MRIAAVCAGLGASIGAVLFLALRFVVVGASVLGGLGVAAGVSAWQWSVRSGGGR